MEGSNTISFSPNGYEAFVFSSLKGSDQFISKFDLRKLESVVKEKIGSIPQGICFDSFGKYFILNDGNLMVFNSKSKA
jgi:hypothetical protein